MTYASNQTPLPVNVSGLPAVRPSIVNPSCDSVRSFATELLRAKSLRPGSGAGMQSVSLSWLCKDIFISHRFEVLHD
jgi:hypothetical protein